MNTPLLIAGLCIVGYLALKRRWPEIKGWIGEKSVALTLSFLPRNQYTILNDLMLREGEHTSQIDHIVISAYGIFVIETKNYKGWIVGDADQDYWTQRVGGRPYRMYNPILQNSNHIRFLRNKFGELEGAGPHIHSIVVFTPGSILQLSGDCGCVVRLHNLNSRIRHYRQPVITPGQCRDMVRMLSEENIRDRETRAAHRQNAKSAFYRHWTRTRNTTCPWCGGDMILRTGTYGEFYGCSNYPRCRYTRQPQ